MTVGSNYAGYDNAEAATLQMQLCLLSNVQKHVASTADKYGPKQRECS